MWNRCNRCNCNCNGNNNRNCSNDDRLRRAYRNGYADGYRVGYDEGFQEGYCAANNARSDNDSCGCD